MKVIICWPYISDTETTNMYIKKSGRQQPADNGGIILNQNLGKW
jgi:hypothetical protein